MGAMYSQYEYERSLCSCLLLIRGEIMAENTIIHEISLAGYKATSTGGMLDLGTWGSYGIEKLHLTLDAAWQDLTITAFFNVKGEVVGKALVGKNGYADVPWEATKENTFAGRIVFEGSMNNQRRISANLNYKVTNHSEITDSDPVPTDDRWNQFVTENKEYRDGAYEAATKAEARAEDAEAASEDAQAAMRAAKASEDAAAASKIAAKNSEDKAKTSADAAAVSEGNANASERAAASSAAAAATSEGNAAESAKNAASAAKKAADESVAANIATIEKMQTDVANKQAAAAASEKAAAASAVAAAGSAAQAEAQKTAAAKSASDAQGYMQTASGAATAANASAENAAGSKAAAGNSASAAAGSEQAAGASEMKAAESERAAKASEQAAAKSAQAALESKTAAATSEVNAAASAKKAQDVADSLPEDYTTAVNDIATLKQQVANITPDNSAIGDKPWSSKHIIDMLCPPLEESGNPVVCYPVAGYPLGVKAKWEPMQEGSGTPSPENIRPIKGRDRVTVTRCGENLSTTEGLDSVGWASTYEDLLDVLNKLPVGTYVLDFTFTLEKFYDHYTSDTAEINAFRINSKFDDGTPCIVTEGETITKAEKLPSVRKITETFVITPQHKGRVATAYFYACGRGDAIDGAPNGTLGEGKISNVTITLGTTAPTTYTPYTGQTNTLTLPETVYGGEVDAASGEGQETWKIIDLANANISLYGINQHGIANFSLVANLNNIYTTPGRAGYFTSSLPQDTATFNNATKIGIMKANASTFYIRLKETDANNEEAAKEYLASINAKLVYELAKPVPFTATGAQPLPALSGTNTVLTDADSATVTGRADPIKRITDLEDAVASQT